jgi:hypothetical protein
MNRYCIIFKIHNILENFFTFRMRVKDEIVSVKKSKVLTFNMLFYFTRSTKIKNS